MRADLALVAAMPANARRTLWKVLAATLPEPIPPSSDAAFAADLAALDGDDGDLRAMFLPGWAAAKARIREELVTRAISAHGKVLVNAEWRLDMVAASSRGHDLRAPIALVTLELLDDG